MEKTNEYWPLGQKCNLLLQDEKIRFAGIINKMGKLVAGGFKKETSPLVDDAELQKLYLELALRVSMRQEFDYCLGPVKYSASHREKATLMSFPIGTNILLVSTEPNLQIDATANKIMKTIGLGY
ncbi:MAG: DUF6659 family protein [Candidatus Nitrosotenuis sp.]